MLTNEAEIKERKVVGASVKRLFLAVAQGGVCAKEATIRKGFQFLTDRSIRGFAAQAFGDLFSSQPISRLANGFHDPDVGLAPAE